MFCIHGIREASASKQGAEKIEPVSSRVSKDPLLSMDEIAKSRIRKRGKNSEKRMKERMAYAARRRERGFTSIELVIVIVVLSLLSASIIIKNPFTIKDYSSIAADQLIADIQYVQMRAMGMRVSQSIKLRVDAGDYGIYTVAGARKTLPGNVKVTGTSGFAGPITFNSIGEPNYYGTIDLSGGKTAGGQTIRVYASTGKTVIE